MDSEKTVEETLQEAEDVKEVISEAKFRRDLTVMIDAQWRKVFEETKERCEKLYAAAHGLKYVPKKKVKDVRGLKIAIPQTEEAELSGLDSRTSTSNTEMN